jgi:hypothetical protein
MLLMKDPSLGIYCLDKTKLDNINKGNYRANKHVEVWAKNAFIE